jgi:signal transduction histidine kinase
LISSLQFGFDEGSEAQIEFQSGRVLLHRTNEPGEHSWTCIELREPRVFCFSGKAQLFTTPNGLIAQGTDHACEGYLAKKPNEYWVDAPLVAGKGKVLGKITLQCDEGLLPEQFDFLKYFFPLLARILDLHIEHEAATRRAVGLERYQAAETSLAMISHNLATRITGLSPLIRLYEDLEASRDRELAELNHLFRSGYEEIRAVVARAKEVFRNAPPVRSRVNLTEVVRSAIEQSSGLCGWSINRADAVEADIDELEFRSALKEVVQNSMDFATEPRLAVKIDCFERDKCEWVSVAVEDNGPGVPESIADWIFDDFFTHRPGRKAGTGLGLAIVRRVAESHGGCARQGRGPGGGACVVMEFPRYGESTDAPGGQGHV